MHFDVLRAAEGRIPDLGELEHRATETSGSLLGWPSPRRAADAIDDTEYDLATIGRLLHLPASDLRGRGHYLLGTNSHLARSLRTRWLRWHASWSVADGIVDPDPATLEILASHRLRSRSYSPTSLQQFAACPYRFLLYSIHPASQTGRDRGHRANGSPDSRQPFPRRAVPPADPACAANTGSRWGKKTWKQPPAWPMRF